MKKNTLPVIALFLLLMIGSVTASYAASEPERPNLFDGNEVRSALPASGQDAFFHYSQGIKYLGKEEFDQAVTSFSMAIQIRGNFAEGYIKRGDAWYLKGDNEMAINDYNTAIALKPDDSESYLGRGLAYKNLGQVKKSEEDLQNACLLGSREACSWQAKSSYPM